MRPRHNRDARVIGTLRRDRSALLRSTALQAAFLAVISVPAAAQAPNARPTGGAVVAGSASISTTAANTLISQSSSRAAVNWNSFNVGSQQSVTFQQPSTSAITLNRVVGPDPSAIAGHITANGQIVISNPAGVVFSKGAIVDTSGLVVTSANITNPNFMSGRMIFDQPGQPNARIVNEGTLTARQAGLVGLVAPQVANSGVINARMGNVVLAGAQTHTVDMYGDGLLSIDVTNQVRQVPVGPDGKPATALVTNTGTILAQGGTVKLTAVAADGIVQNLVDAGGKISARGGRVEIAGTGGNVQVDGDVIVNGRGPNGHGGQIAVNATGTVTLTNSARLSANGSAGGGTIAVGTTLARAAGGPSVTSARTARQVVVQQGATISADATRIGNGGKVTLLSSERTQFAGSITARGGEHSGDGGNVEISGATVGLTGSVDVSAPHGATGNILLDPVNVTIDGTIPSSVTPTDNTDPNLGFDTAAGTGNITPTQLEQLHGNIHIEATNNLTVNSAITLSGTSQNLTLEAGNNVTVNASIAVNTGTLNLIAASPNSPAPVVSGGVTISGGAQLTASGDINITGGTGTTLLGNFIATGTGGTLRVIADNIAFDGEAVLYAPGGTVVLAPRTAGRAIDVTNSGNANPNALSLNGNILNDIITTSTLALGLPSSTPTTGPINIGNAGDFVDFRPISSSPTLALYSGGAVTQGGSFATGALTGVAASATLNSAGNVIGTLGSFSAGTDLAVATSGALTVAGPITAGGSVSLSAIGYTVGGNSTAGILTINGNINANALSLIGTDGVTQNGGSITANTLSGVVANDDSATFSGQNFVLGSSSNAINTLGDLAVTGNVTLNTTTPLNVTGTVQSTGAFGSSQFGITSGGSISIASTATLDLSNNGFLALVRDRAADAATGQRDPRVRPVGQRKRRLADEPEQPGRPTRQL